jgi:hypothetical protein
MMYYSYLSLAKIAYPSPRDFSLRAAGFKDDDGRGGDVHFHQGPTFPVHFRQKSVHSFIEDLDAGGTRNCQVKSRQLLCSSGS